MTKVKILVPTKNPPTLFIHNNFIEGKLNLNNMALKTLLAIAFKVQCLSKTGVDFDNEIVFTSKEIGELVGLEPNSYHYFKKILTELRQKNIEMRSIYHSNEIWSGGFLESFRFTEYGKFTVKFNKELVPFYYNVNNKFTLFELERLTHLYCKNSIKLYMLLYQYKNLSNYRIFKIDEFKKLFGGEQYKNFSHLNKNVISKMMFNLFCSLCYKFTINNKDYEFNQEHIFYYYHRNGKSYDKIVFLFTFNEKNSNRLILNASIKYSGSKINEIFGIKENIFKNNAHYRLKGFNHIYKLSEDEANG